MHLILLLLVCYISQVFGNNNTTNSIRMVYGDVSNMQNGWPPEIGELLICINTADANQKPPICQTNDAPTKCSMMNSSNRQHPIPNVFGMDNLASACSLAAKYCREIYKGNPGNPGPLCTNA